MGRGEGAAAYLPLIGHQVISLFHGMDIWPLYLNLEFHHVHYLNHHHRRHRCRRRRHHHLHLHCIHRVIAAKGKR